MTTTTLSLFLVSRTDSRKYERKNKYGHFIVCAESEEEAAQIHPNGISTRIYDQKRKKFRWYNSKLRKYHDDTWIKAYKTNELYVIDVNDLYMFARISREQKGIVYSKKGIHDGPTDIW
jgi:hypothetical protein